MMDSREWKKICDRNHEDIHMLCMQADELENRIVNEVKPFISQLQDAYYDANDNVPNPESVSDFDVISDAEADELYSKWDDLSEMLRELQDHRRYLTNLLRSF